MALARVAAASLTAATIGTVAYYQKQSPNSQNPTANTNVTQDSPPILRNIFNPTRIALCDKAQIDRETQIPPTKSPSTPLELAQAVGEELPQKLQRPAAALFPALGATGLFYPLNLITTLVQKENLSIFGVIARVTDNGKKPTGLWAGATPILRNAALQRCAQFLVYGEAKAFLEKTNVGHTTTNNLLAGIAASFVDTAIMAPAEIKSIAAQIARASQQAPEAVIKTFSRGRGALAILARDMIANSFGFTLPQELREAWDMKHETPQRLATTFLSLAAANVITTPIDGIKTAVLTQKEVSTFNAVSTLWENNKLWSGYALRTCRQAGVFSLVFVGAEEVYKNLFPKTEK